MGRKGKWILVGGLFALCFTVLMYWQMNREIGTVKGPEMEHIILNDIRYIRDYSDEYQNYSAKDKGIYLGIVTDGKIKMRVYSVDGDKERNYLYALFGYDGCFYVRESLTEQREGGQ